MRRRVVAIAIVLAALAGACERVIDLSRRSTDAMPASDVLVPDDGSGSGSGFDDGGVEDAGGGLDA